MTNHCRLVMLCSSVFKTVHTYTQLCILLTSDMTNYCRLVMLVHKYTQLCMYIVYYTIYSVVQS